MTNQEFFNKLPLNCKDDPISIQEYKGYRLAAPKSFWDADQELRDAVVGGCGPGGSGDKLVPDTMYLLSVTAACAIHDWCFAIWNDKAGFKLANNLFKNNMLRIIDQRGGNNRIKCLRQKRAVKYFKGVHYLGEPSFFDSHLQYI
ncbi:MAG: hypothetical protein KAR45_12990 [Desulfobacteraceae bacterium]|nr:hypothetical protein [Desulfobacteraceae bacterium]